MQRRLFLLAGCSMVGIPASSAFAAQGKEASPYQSKALRNMSEQPSSLEREAQGQLLVVVVMKGHWCQVCLGQLWRLSQAKKRLAELGAIAVGLNADSAKANRAAAQASGIELQLLSDPRHGVISRLGLWLVDGDQPMPALLVFDRCGKEIARSVGRAPEEQPEAALFEFLKKHAGERCAPANA